MKKLFLYLCMTILTLTVSGQQDKNYHPEAACNRAGNLVEVQASYHRAIIQNEQLNEFCKETLVPILKELDLMSFYNVLKMNIEESNGIFNVKISIENSGFIVNDKLPTNYQASLCILAKHFFMIIEAPVDCSLIKVLNNRNKLEFSHMDGIEDEAEREFEDMMWEFQIEDSTMKLTNLDIGDLEQVDDKQINLQTGRLE